MLNESSRVAGPFAGDDVTTALPFEFKVFVDSDLAVWVTDSAGTANAIVLDVDYTVTLNADQETDPGGTVTLTDPLATGYTCAIVSDLPYDQPLDLHNAGKFHAQRIEDALDRIVMQIQQLHDSLARSIRVPVGESLTTLPSAPARVGKVPVFNGDGDVSLALIGDIGTVIDAVHHFEQSFTATAAQTIFSLTLFTYPVGGNALEVVMNGLVLQRGADYLETSESSFTLTRAAEEGDLVVARGAIAESSAPSTQVCIAIALDSTSVGTARATFINPFATPFVLVDVVASLTTAQVSGSIFTLDINEAGVSILSTKLTIDNGEKNSTTAATAAVISDGILMDGAEITVDVDQIGDGTAAGCKVYLVGYPAS